MITKIESLTRTQVSMDRCTGGTILKLRAASVTMEASYGRVDTYRAAVVLSVFNVTAIELFRKAARVERWIQKSAKTLWDVEAKQWKWVMFSCKLPWLVKTNAFPEFPYSIIDPDLALVDIQNSVGWLKTPSAIVLKMDYGTLHSTAKLERKRPFFWTVAWTR